METQRSRAQRFISLREQFETDYLALRVQVDKLTDRAWRLAIGRCKTLEALVADLGSITAGMKPMQVQEVVVGILHELAEDKATWMVNSIKKRRLYGINELGEWSAEGAIAQIDEVVPVLMKGLFSKARPTPQIHGRFFQVFQVFRQLVSDDVVDPQRNAARWRVARAHWYQDVAILEFPGPEVLLEQISQGMDPLSRERPKVLWSLDETAAFRATVGDVILSLLSGRVWIVTASGLESVDALLPGEPA
jgi:hypothetical protein